MKSWILFSVLALTLVGCGGRGSLPCVETTQAEVERKDEEELPEPFANVRVQLGVGGSESMVGFVTIPGSRYYQAISEITTLLQNRKVPVDYWRIGSNPDLGISEAKRLTANQFLDARTREFYCYPDQQDQAKVEYPCITSTLGQFYEIPNPESPSPENGETPNPSQERVLKIFITNLEQASTATGLLSGLVTEELKKNEGYKAVVLGSRSQFEGNVYSADNSHATFAYSSQGGSVDEKGRPFFILITGPTDTVDEVVKELRRSTDDFSRSFRASTFTLDQKETLTLDNSSFAARIEPCVDQIGAINGQYPTQDQEKEWLLIEQTDCSPNGNKSTNEPLKIPIPSQPSALLTQGEFTPELFEISDPLLTLDMVEIVPHPSGESARLLLKTKIRGNELPPSQGRLINITLEDRQWDQAVWQAWDMDISQPDGSKTQHLRRFINGIRGGIANKQDAVRFCIGYSRY